MRRSLVVAVVLAGCGPEAAVDSAGGSTSGSTTFEVEPTTGGTGEPVDPCACDVPVVHDGDLRAEDLATYQGACLVEVTGSVRLEGLGDASLLTGPVTVAEVSFVDTPGLDDATIAGFMAEVDAMYQCAGGIVECTCIGLIPDGVTSGCSQWSGGSAVVGESEGGPFNGTTAFFGWIGNNVELSQLVLMIVDETADIEAAKQAGIFGDEGRPKAQLETGRNYASWIGTSSSPVAFYDADADLSVDEVALEITGRLGNWSTFDPADPPRLVGTIKSADPNADVVLDGAFEAAFCDRFVWYLTD